MLGYRIDRTIVVASALLAAASVFFEPVRSTLYFGQINLVLMALVLWDASRGEQSRLKGIGVGIAAGIKLTPAYFVLYYIALRQWRAAAVATITIAATIGVTSGRRLSSDHQTRKPRCRTWNTPWAPRPPRTAGGLLWPGVAIGILPQCQTRRQPNIA